MSIIVTFYLFSASSVSPHHCLSTRRAQEKKKSKSKKHLPPILASWHCERIFLISRNLLLQNLNSYDMSWLKYRAQDIHVNVLLWGRVRGRLVQSLHSKSEGKGCVRQRGRVDHYCPGHRLQKKTAGTMVPLAVSRWAIWSPCMLKQFFVRKKWIYLLVSSLGLSSVKRCRIFVVLLYPVVDPMGNLYPMLRSPEPL